FDQRYLQAKTACNRGGFKTDISAANYEQPETLSKFFAQAARVSQCPECVYISGVPTLFFRQNARSGTGCQHQPVIIEPVTGVQLDLLFISMDCDYPATRQQFNSIRLVERRLLQIQPFFFGKSGDIFF